MQIENLATFEAGSIFEADLAIIGGGPAGLTIAREFFGTSTRVIVIESGLLEEAPAFSALAEVESIGEPRTDEQKRRRISLHGAGASSWSQEAQPYGVRCRALGGSTHAWAGKSAAFDRIDFDKRSWVPYSGWPISRKTLEPYLDRAARALNLGPNFYDESLWKLIGAKPELYARDLQSFFWQFARSRIDGLDIMRFGREFCTLTAKNVRVLLNATVTNIALGPDGNRLEGLEISTIEGKRSTVKAKFVVLAGGAIENARLLLASNGVHVRGIGNSHDLVGRFLMDHAGARVGRFALDSVDQIAKLFGFYGVRHDGRTYMYMHGLAPTADLQEREQLLNCAVYFMPERSLDDPWDALKRLLRRGSIQPFQDAVSVLSGAGLIAKGVGMKALTSHAMPNFLKDFIVNMAIRHSPNLVAEEFQSRGLPHKLTDLWIEVIAEQRPDPESRVSLSTRFDRLNVPLAKVDWRIHDDERRTINHVANLTRETFVRTGLPEPVLESWLANDPTGRQGIIDMAHTLGTTRMAESPASGVVDANCRVHGVQGLYIAGSSTFPTSGHANPVLMILSLAIRLSDTIKSELGQLHA